MGPAMLHYFAHVIISHLTGQVTEKASNIGNSATMLQQRWLATMSLETAFSFFVGEGKVGGGGWGAGLRDRDVRS